MSEPRILGEAHRIKARLERMTPLQRREALAALKRTDPLMAKVVAIVCGNGPDGGCVNKVRKLGKAMDFVRGGDEF